jgi:Fic family protein
MELEALFNFLNTDTEYHPVQQSWLLHFRLLAIPLFSEAKSKMASLLQFYWLKKKGYGLANLLSIEHELYLRKNDYFNFFGDQSRPLTHDQANDLDEPMQLGMLLYENHLERLRQLLKVYYRKQVEFDKLNPRQKNIMNYVFDFGYKLKEMDETILNKRQKLIMYIVQNKGFISTKELVNEFDCNRKTIQRDFAVLTELNLVRVIGQGAGLRYAVNLHEKKHPVMEKYQAEFLKQEEEAIAADET